MAERDWQQFHSAETWQEASPIEAGELLECFQWSESADRDRGVEELADVLTYCYLLAHTLNADPEAIILEKLGHTRRKYPVEKARGRSAKYGQL